MLLFILWGIVTGRIMSGGILSAGVMPGGIMSGTLCPGLKKKTVRVERWWVSSSRSISRGWKGNSKYRANVCTAWSRRRQIYGSLPSLRWYQIILFASRGTCHACERLAQGRYTKRGDRESNVRLVDDRSNFLDTQLPIHSRHSNICNESATEKFPKPD